MSAADRLAVGYEPRFDIDAEVGHQGEIVVADLIEALKSGASVQIKTDERFSQTGNLYIEYQCIKGGRWVADGIATTECDLWCQVLGAEKGNAGILVFEVEQLRRACRMLRNDGYKKQCGRGSHPTRGVCASVQMVASYYRAAAPVEAKQEESP